ncbi:hypothetical protein PRIPAC_77178 [Pristionchus pacificus]|uniref:Uncharacterized protein n=1 Tax=Pristionchus pacificus TaxID=54126 RepID=A0A2A6C402_PRIPA|nr:hypothetical protein PRIPAC_77178 [Pristionchus pacificus]|eukprot:PDM72905.1 hypothetical protein PRIPAC_39339 [Pristionchus pacificus]
MDDHSIESMTISHQGTKEEEITKSLIIYTISDSNGYSSPSPSTSTSSEGKDDDDQPWKSLPINPPDDPIDLYYRRYATIQPAPPNTLLYEKRHERGRLPSYLRQMNRQSSEAPSETPSKSAKSKRSRVPKRSRFVRSIHYIGSHHHLFIIFFSFSSFFVFSDHFCSVQSKHPLRKSSAQCPKCTIEAFTVIAADLQTISNTKNGTTMAEHVKQAYIKLLNIDRWSAIHNIESSSEGTYTWTFASPFFLLHFHALYNLHPTWRTLGTLQFTPHTQLSTTYSPLVAILVTAGLPLMRVVTKAIYVAIENGYFGTMMYIESKLEGNVFSSEETKEKQEVGNSVDAESCYDSSDDDNEEDRKIREELMQNFTIRSLVKFMTSNLDVYNGDYGRVEFRKSDL